MSNSILVVYATRYGSTQEVAEKVAAKLRENGQEVDVQPAKKAQSLEGYRAVVLGAPLYIGKLLKDAHRFLTRNQQALEKCPVAVFALGPTHGGDKELDNVRPQLDKELAKYPWLKPVTVELFGGKYDPAKLRFPDNLLGAIPASPLHGAEANDMRNWDAIEAWSNDLAAKL